jgi:hypothetical protein
MRTNTLQPKKGCLHSTKLNVTIPFDLWIVHSQLIKNLHVQKISCGRTKCQAVVVNVFAPSAMQQILKELETVKYISVMVHTSNHKSLKSVPVLIRYFIPRKGVKTKMIEFHNLKGETADVLTTYIMDVLDKHKLSNEIIAICGDNCNKFRRSCKLQEKEQCVCQAND